MTRTALNVARTTAAWNAARGFARLHSHIEWTGTETVVRFDTASCGRGYTVNVDLVDEDSGGRHTFRQVVWLDESGEIEDATPVAVDHHNGSGFHHWHA